MMSVSAPRPWTTRPSPSRTRTLTSPSASTPGVTPWTTYSRSDTSAPSAASMALHAASIGPEPTAAWTTFLPSPSARRTVAVGEDLEALEHGVEVVVRQLEAELAQARRQAGAARVLAEHQSGLDGADG